MQEKTLNRVISKKMAKFVNSLPPKMRKPVAENLFVAGGAIASLSTGEKVKDYDVYIKDRHVLKELVEYLVYKFLANEKNKDRKDNNHINPSIFVKQDVDGRVRVYIKSAGVASTTEEKDSYKYFEGHGPGIGAEWVQTTVMASTTKQKKEVNYDPTFFTENSITLGNADIQIITRFTGEPCKVVEEFDYLHTKNYWHFTNIKGDNPNLWQGRTVWRTDALVSLLTKTLQYSGSKYPLCAMIRTKKFLMRGYHVPVDIYVRIAFELNELDLKDPKVLQDQLIGVDFAYFAQLISMIQADVKENPEMKIDNAYICQLLDKMDEVDIGQSLKELNVMQQRVTGSGEEDDGNEGL